MKCLGGVGHGMWWWCYVLCKYGVSWWLSSVDMEGGRKGLDTVLYPTHKIGLSSSLFIHIWFSFAKEEAGLLVEWRCFPMGMDGPRPPVLPI